MTDPEPGMLRSLYQHADIFLANDAASVVWRPILDWIRRVASFPPLL